MSQVETLLASLPRGKKLATVLRIVADLLESSNDERSGVVVRDDDHPRTAKELKAELGFPTAGWLRSRLTPDGRGPRNQPLYRPSRVLAAAESARNNTSKEGLEDPFSRKTA